MRPAFSTQVESQSAVREAVSKLGSGYDYRLDDDDTKYYCSELIIHAYSTAHPRIDLWKRELLGDNIVYPQDIYEDTSNWKVIKEAP
jgi:uncharacterized protein YycO